MRTGEGAWQRRHHDLGSRPAAVIAHRLAHAAVGGLGDQHRIARAEIARAKDRIDPLGSVRDEDQILAVGAEEPRHLRRRRAHSRFAGSADETADFADMLSLLSLYDCQTSMTCWLETRVETAPRVC